MPASFLWLLLPRLSLLFPSLSILGCPHIAERRGSEERRGLGPSDFIPSPTSLQFQNWPHSGLRHDVRPHSSSLHVQETSGSSPGEICHMASGELQTPAYSFRIVLLLDFMRNFIYICMCVCTYIYVYIYMYRHVPMYVYLCIFIYMYIYLWASQVVLVVKNPPANAGSVKRCRFDLWVRKISWRRQWQPTPVFLPGEFFGQRSLAGYSLRICRVKHD